MAPCVNRSVIVATSNKCLGKPASSRRRYTICPKSMAVIAQVENLRVRRIAVRNCGLEEEKATKFGPDPKILAFTFRTGQPFHFIFLRSSSVNSLSTASLRSDCDRILETLDDIAR